MAKKDSARENRAAKAEQMRLDREKAEKRQRNLITGIIVVVVVALVGAAWFAIDYTMQQNETPELTPPSVTSDNGLLVTPEDLGGTTDDDTVEIVIWEDMSCPGCAGFVLGNAEYLDQIVADGQASIEYRFANFLDRNTPNSHSTRAAAAAVCVYEEDGVDTFKSFQLAAYAAQPQGGNAGPDDEGLADMAIQAGASDATAECIENGNYQRWIRDTAGAFADSGVSATPGIIIGGEILEGDPSAENVQAALDAIRGDAAGGDTEDPADEVTEDEATEDDATS